MTGARDLGSTVHVPEVTFTKYHGLQNDFIVVDAHERRLTPAAAARLCHRRRGIGADGILSLGPPAHAGAELSMHVLNADGSTAEMCGNGLRCVVRHHLDATGRAEVGVSTGAGLMRGWRDGEHIGVTLGSATLIEDGIVVDGLPVGTGVSMGNPHLVLSLIPEHESVLEHARRRGPTLEQHGSFPQRVNVSFPQRLGDNEVRLVVFERGSGITDACGTGAGACVSALARRGLVDATRAVQVHLPGGPLKVELHGDPKRAQSAGEALADVRIIGEAVRVFEGRVEVAQDELQPV